MKVARSVTSLASRSSDHSTRNNSKGQSRSESVGAIQLAELSKQKAGAGNTPEMPKQPALEILREDSVHISAKSRNPEEEHAPGNHGAPRVGLEV